MSGSGDDDVPDDVDSDVDTDTDAGSDPAPDGDETREDVETGEEAVDLPADVEATLTQLLAEGAESARRREVDETAAIVETVETVARNKVPDGDVRDRLVHGCAAVDRLVPDEPLVAAEYLDAMARLIGSDDSA